MPQDLISTGKAAKMLGITPTTLRSWDKKGKLTSIKTPTGRRLFSIKKIRIFIGNSLFDLALNWASEEKPTEPENIFYCSNSANFQTRISTFEQELQKNPLFGQTYFFIVGAVGEIGNNAFDHNLGNWPDVPGLFFGYDFTKREIVLADRGQGLLETLGKVKSSLTTHEEAMKTAFTEILSGRAPEERGNGLKFVRKVVPLANMEIFFQSGNATVFLSKKSKRLEIETSEKNIRGCFAHITF